MSRMARLSLPRLLLFAGRITPERWEVKVKLLWLRCTKRMHTNFPYLDKTKFSYLGLVLSWLLLVLLVLLVHLQRHESQDQEVRKYVVKSHLIMGRSETVELQLHVHLEFWGTSQKRGILGRFSCKNNLSISPCCLQQRLNQLYPPGCPER